MKTIQSLFLSIFIASGLIVAVSALADDVAPASAETELLAVLRSNAPASEKAITCKKLAIQGSAAAVPDLAKLLPDPQLSSWARTALEAIPGDEADEALRTAAESLDGRLLIGMLNSIGVRRDTVAVDALVKRLQDRDAEVASAAAVALGRIGNPDATSTLRKTLADSPHNVRSAIAEACVLCAERLLADGDTAQAIEIYDEVRAADVPQQRVIEATRGAILARGDEGIPLLLEQFRSDDRTQFRLALGIAREFPGKSIDQALANELATVRPERAALLIRAMADRGDRVVLAAVLQAAESGPRQTRLAAIESLAEIGDETCLAALMTIATDGDLGLADAAKETLARFPDGAVDKQIIAQLPDAAGKRYVLLLELVGKRRLDAISEVMRGLDDSDASVRSAALTALGETITLDRLPVLIKQVVDSKNPADQPVAIAALRAASVRMPSRDRCAAQLASALEDSPPATKTTLLEILSEVGGAKALQTLADAANSGDAQLLDTSSRLLGKWNTIDADSVLLDLAKSAPQDKYKVRALRGYLGLARKFADGTKRASMCQDAIDNAIRPEEQKLALEVLVLRPSTAGLAVAVGSQQLPALKTDATKATLAIAQKLGEQGVDVKQLMSSGGLNQVDLEIIKAQYGAGATQKDVTKELQKHVDGLPLIALSSGSYNAAFGGDPTPGVVKQLKIEYRMNGKTGEVSFPENAMILLPMPE